MAEELLIECELWYLLFGCRVAFAAAHGRFTEQQKARRHLLGRVLCRVQRTKLGEELLIEWELCDSHSVRRVVITAAHVRVTVQQNARRHL